MSSQYINYRNIRFTLYEMIEAHKLNRFAYYADYDKDAFDMSLDVAKQIADTHMFPYYVEMDRKKAYFENGTVKTHPQLKILIQAVAEGGWISAHAPFEPAHQRAHQGQLFVQLFRRIPVVAVAGDAAVGSEVQM